MVKKSEEAKVAPVEGAEVSSQATPPEPAPAPLEGSKEAPKEDVTQIKAQLSGVQKAYNLALAELNQLKKAGVDVSELKSDLAELRGSIDALSSAQIATQINTLFASGDEETARQLAKKTVSQELKRYGLDLQTDPRLRSLREIDDPVEAHRAWIMVKPALTFTPKAVEPAPAPQPNPEPAPVAETPEEMKARIRREVEEELGVHQIVTAQPSGGVGDNLGNLPPVERVQEADRRLRQSRQ